ncbi:MAG: DUF554 domain-containing protein [Lachnospiraceae bacterium]
MLGTVVNMGAVIIGGALGLILKNGIPKKLADSLMSALGLCTLFLGVKGSLDGENSLILIISMVLGTLLGEAIDLDSYMNRFGLWMESRFRNLPFGNDKIAEGFVTASLLFCVGAMSIVGSLESGLTGNHEIIFNKSMLDFVAAILFASSLGIGVLLSSLFVLVYQGSIVLLAHWLAPYLTDSVINEMSCVGSVIIIGLGLNMLGITKLKVMNFVPAIFLPIIITAVISLF